LGEPASNEKKTGGVHARHSGNRPPSCHPEEPRGTHRGGGGIKGIHEVKTWEVGKKKRKGDSDARRGGAIESGKLRIVQKGTRKGKGNKYLEKQKKINRT